MSGSPFAFIWSPPGTNYPAGGDAWSSQPVAVAPPGTYFTPGGPLDAEEVNYNLGQVSQNLQYLAAARGVKWGTPILLTGGTDLVRAASWDSLNNRWLLAHADIASSSWRAIYSYDGQDTWQSLSSTLAANGTAIIAMAITQDGNTAAISYTAILTTTGGFVGVQVFKQNAGTTTAPASGQTTGTNLCDVAGTYFNGVHIVAVGSTTAADSLIVGSSDGWVTRLFSYPVATYQIEHWALAASGSICVAVPTYSLLATPTIYTTVDGSTWLTHTGTTGGNLTANDEITGIAYGADAAGACFLMTSTGTGGQPNKTFRSSDGINWTLVATTTVDFVRGLSYAGTGMWFGQVARAGSLIGRVVVSTDGGATWHFTNATQLAGTNTVTAWFTSGSSNQVLACSDGYARPSMCLEQGALMT